MSDLSPGGQKLSAAIDELGNVALEQKAQLNKLEAAAGDMERALAALDAVLDFSEPGSDDKPMIFEDWSDLNAAFEEARAALLSYRALKG